MEKTVEYVDITPTWREILPTLVELLKNPKTHTFAFEELERMAWAADKHLAGIRAEDK